VSVLISTFAKLSRAIVTYRPEPRR